MIVSSNTQPRLKFKLVFLGDSGVGKTSILARHLDGEYFNEAQSTIAINFLKIRVKVEETSVNLIIGDTGGQEQYHSIVPNYFRGVDVALIVDSIDSNRFN